MRANIREKIRGRIVTMVQPLLRCHLRMRGVDIGSGVRVNGHVVTHLSLRGSISIGSGVTLTSLISHNSLEARGPVILKTLTHDAVLSIGDESGLTSTSISASREVRIGRRVLIGSGVVITDSDHHPISMADVSERRHAPRPVSNPIDTVVIEDDVFIGARSIVLKGVTIGRGSVIGAGSVVSSSVPAMTIAAGNPCRVIRPIGAASS